MPKILVAHPSADVYGSDLQLLESIAGLRDAGWRVTLLVPAAGPLVELVEGADVRIVPFPVLRKALLRPLALARLVARFPIDLFRLVQVIRRLRPDVVYVNTVTIPWWVVAARLTSVPVLAHVHEAEEEAPRPVRVALNAPLLLARSVIANSNASRTVLTAAVPRLARRTTVVVNGVPDPGATAYEAAEPALVALVARLSPRKGIDVALEAIARLRRQDRDVRLMVCGTAFPGYEWYADELRARAEQSDLAGAVTFAGYVNPTAPLLAQSAVVLVPSRVEPFGNTVVEGMLAQRPVVASRIQGPAEIIVDGTTGVLVRPDDPAALAGAVADLLDNPARAREIGEQARLEAARTYSLETYRDRIALAAGALIDDQLRKEDAA